MTSSISQRDQSLCEDIRNPSGAQGLKPSPPIFFLKRKAVQTVDRKNSRIKIEVRILALRQSQFVIKLLILTSMVREDSKVSELKFLVYKLILLSPSCEGR
jgi:hypothetical protein